MSVSDRSLCVLNVSDVASARAAKSAILSGAGFHVVDADSGSEALWVAQSEPDLVLLDVRKPGAEALAVCRRLRALPEGCTPAILCLATAPAAADGAAAAIAAGADAYLVEPIAPGDLVATCAALINRSRRRRSDSAERRRAEETHALTERKHHLLANTLTDAIFDWDLAANTIAWSDSIATVFGHALAEPSTSADWFVDHVHPGDRDKLVAHRAEALDGGSDRLRYECRFRRGDGTFADVVVRAAVMRDDSRRPVRLVGGMADLTPHKAVAEQLRAAQKMEAIGLLAGGIAHDFNNLLTAMAGFVELEYEEAVRQGRNLTHLEEIRSAASRGSALTRQLLAFSRRQRLQPVDVDPNALVEGMLNMLRRLIPSNITIERAFDPAVPLVKVDHGQLEQVILNLALNARDAMPQGGTLTVGTAVRVVLQPGEAQAEQPPGVYVRILVRDTGAGIDPAIRHRIFEPFFTTKPAGQGTGLGLAAVYGIVKQSNGFIDAQSAPGAGTTFCVELPAVLERVAVTSATQEAPQATPQGYPATLLVVEDTAAVLRLLTAALTAAGYKVLTAADGQEATAILKSYLDRIDVVLTDMVMPGISGEEVTRLVRALRPTTKVILMSGYSDRLLQMAHSADALLPKPWTPSQLIAAIRQVLASGAESVVSAGV